MAWVQLAGGLAILFVAGEALVHRGAHLALSYRVPKAVVGAVVLGFGTSLPELVVCVTAALQDRPGIAIGNVVGSNIANVGLILGVAATIATVHVERSLIRADLPLGALAGVLLLLGAGLPAVVSRGLALVLLGGFAFYLWLSLRHTRNHRLETLGAERPDPTPALDLSVIALGLAGMAVGAPMLVAGASDIARQAGVSEAVIGLSGVAVGTSLPELAATIAAARRREVDIAVGNIAGSNVFNVLFILGTTAMVRPVPVSPTMAVRDFAVMIGFALLAFPLLVQERRIGRRQGALMLACYAGYMFWVFRSG